MYEPPDNPIIFRFECLAVELFEKGLKWLGGVVLLKKICFYRWNLRFQMSMPGLVSPPPQASCW